MKELILALSCCHNRSDKGCAGLGVPVPLLDDRMMKVMAFKRSCIVVALERG